MRIAYVIPLTFVLSVAQASTCEDYLATIQLLKDNEVHSEEMKIRVEEAQNSAINSMTSDTHTQSDNVVEALTVSTKAIRAINEMFSLFSELLPHIKFRTAPRQSIEGLIDQMVLASAATTVIKHRLMYESTCGGLR